MPEKLVLNLSNPPKLKKITKRDNSGKTTLEAIRNRKTKEKLRESEISPNQKMLALKNTSKKVYKKGGCNGMKGKIVGNNDKLKNLIEEKQTNTIKNYFKDC